ncbi:MAG: 2-oxoisovalerate dehydrogenase [Bacillaceae bacterium G1]|nr:alpha-ketoacid dehydrogenase subunit beta [Bacillota bacterium]OJF17499.1 MAG: 2-oxoisovalerate dehydrogenase [Bacillaceae bacterium G1]
MANLTMIQAINDAMRTALKTYPEVLIFGEDVGVNGGVFRATDGLQKEFGEERVFDTPLAESAIIGTAVGMAIMGLRPVAEIQFSGFYFEAFDALLSQAARTRFRSGGRYHCPLVVRSPYGGGVRTPELHSDSVEGYFLHAPGLKVVIPSNPYEAKGLLLAAIEDDDPVIFLEHMKLYRSFRQEVPEGYYTVPLGKANVVKEGTDVTIITYGAMVHTSLKAAEELEEERPIKVEIIDLRTLNPLDIDTVIQSVQKTNRAVVVHEATRTGGPAAEITALINEKAILHLEAPVMRVTGYDTVYPFTMIEDEWLPNIDRIKQAVNEVLDF